MAPIPRAPVGELRDGAGASPPEMPRESYTHPYGRV